MRRRLWGFMTGLAQMQPDRVALWVHTHCHAFSMPAIKHIWGPLFPAIYFAASFKPRWPSNNRCKGNSLPFVASHPLRSRTGRRLCLSSQEPLGLVSDWDGVWLFVGKSLRSFSPFQAQCLLIWVFRTVGWKHVCAKMRGEFPNILWGTLNHCPEIVSVHPSSWPAGANMEVWTLSPHPGQTGLTPNDKKAMILSSHNRSSTVVSACQFSLSTMLSMLTTARWCGL